MLAFLISLAALLTHLVCVRATYSFTTAELCTTKYGHASVNPVKTTTYALTALVTITHKFTTTPTVTITPPAQTTTSTTTATTTSTVVTTPTSTFTATDSVTSTATITSVTTATQTATTTTTTTTDTTTVPTPAGFTPLASEAGTLEQRAPSKALQCPQVGNPGAFSEYPTSVICGALVVGETTTTTTFTAQSTASTTLAPVTDTLTSTVTTTITTTSAAAPVSTTTTTTLSFSTTTTATSTETDTVTSTITAVQASNTVYAACSPNNVVNHANGDQGIFGAFGSSTTNEVAISDPVACCVNCQQAAGCLGYAQYPGEAQCYYFTNGMCDASQTFGQTFETSSEFPPSAGYTIGNGPCGQIGNGGSSG